MKNLPPSNNIEKFPINNRASPVLNRSLTADQVRAVRVSTESQEALAKKYGVSVSVIRSVITARSYRSVKGISVIPEAPKESVHVLVDIPDQMNAVTASGDICDINSPHAERYLLWRILFDQETKAFYVEPVFNAITYHNLTGFLGRAWAKKSDYFFEGKPSVLKLSKKTPDHIKGIERWLLSDNIRLDTIGKNSGAFVGSATTWVKCMANLDLSESSISRDELNAIVKKWQVIAFAVGWYQRHGKNPCAELGILDRPDNIGLQITFVNTPVYFARTGSDDYLKKFKAYWDGVKVDYLR